MDKVQKFGKPVNKSYSKGTGVASSNNFSDAIRMETAEVPVVLVPAMGDVTGQLQRSMRTLKTPYKPVKFNRHFGRTYYLHYQG
jgi:aspartokinase